MTGTVELDGDGRHLLIRFPYDPHLVGEVKSLPRRRWDPAAKVWRVPRQDLETVSALLQPYGFSFTGELAEQVPQPPPPDPDGPTLFDTLPPEPAPAPAPDALTVSDLNDRVRSVLRGAFPEPLWVVGEVVGHDRNKDREHVFFTLVEKQEGRSRPAAQVEVALFAGSRALVERRSQAAPEPFALRDGLQVRLLVRVDLYRPTGRYQVIVEDIDPSFTLGKLALDRERILRELRDKGLDRLQPALALPSPALRIGVLSSPDAEGWNDFRRQLEESGLSFAVTLHPVRVQGEAVKGTVLAGLQWFARRAAEHDVLCIVRGGGSRTDLAWFDDLEIATAVARHPLPVLIGIGHQRDRSVLDEIARSLKTPTAVGAFLVERAQEELDALDDHTRRLCDLATGLLADRRGTLRTRAQDLRREVDARLNTARAGLANARAVLLHGTRQHLREHRHRLTGASGRLRTGTALRLERFAGGLRATATALRTTSHRLLERAGDHLDHQGARLRLLDPARVVQRGYAIVRRPDRSVVTGVGGLEPGQPLTLQLRDGEVGTTIDDVQPRDP